MHLLHGPTRFVNYANIFGEPTGLYIHVGEVRGLSLRAPTLRVNRELLWLVSVVMLVVIVVMRMRMIMVMIGDGDTYVGEDEEHDGIVTRGDFLQEFQNGK